MELDHDFLQVTGSNKLVIIGGGSNGKKRPLAAGDLQKMT